MKFRVFESFIIYIIASTSVEALTVTLSTATCYNDITAPYTNLGSSNSPSACAINCYNSNPNTTALGLLDNKCFCTTSIATLQSSGAVTASKCNINCPGNSGYDCGGDSCLLLGLLCSSTYYMSIYSVQYYVETTTTTKLPSTTTTSSITTTTLLPSTTTTTLLPAMTTTLFPTTTTTLLPTITTTLISTTTTTLLPTTTAALSPTTTTTLMSSTTTTTLLPTTTTTLLPTTTTTLIPSTTTSTLIPSTTTTILLTTTTTLLPTTITTLLPTTTTTLLPSTTTTIIPITTTTTLIPSPTLIPTTTSTLAPNTTTTIIPITTTSIIPSTTITTLLPSTTTTLSITNVTIIPSSTITTLIPSTTTITVIPNTTTTSSITNATVIPITTTTITLPSFTTTASFLTVATSAKPSTVMMNSLGTNNPITLTTVGSYVNNIMSSSTVSLIFSSVGMSNSTAVTTANPSDSSVTNTNTSFTVNDNYSTNPVTSSTYDKYSSYQTLTSTTFASGSYISNTGSSNINFISISSIVPNTVASTVTITNASSKIYDSYSNQVASSVAFTSINSSTIDNYISSSFNKSSMPSTTMTPINTVFATGKNNVSTIAISSSSNSTIISSYINQPISGSALLTTASTNIYQTFNSTNLSQLTSNMSSVISSFSNVSNSSLVSVSLKPSTQSKNKQINITTKGYPISTNRVDSIASKNYDNFTKCWYTEWVVYGCSGTCGTNAQRKRTRQALTYGLCIDIERMESCSVLKCDPLGDKTLAVVAAVLHALGCTYLLIIVAVTLVLCSIFRATNYERLLQSCQEIALLLAHIMIATLIDKSDNTRLCQFTDVMLQYFFLVLYTFILLEAIQAYYTMTNIIFLNGIMKPITTMIIGWGFTAVYAASVGLFNRRHMMSQFSCWINLDTDWSFSATMPIMLLSIAAFIFTESAGIQYGQNLILTNDQRRFTAEFSQKGLYMKIPLHLLCWYIGAVATYYRYFPLYVVVFGLNISLGIVIVLFHTFGNDKPTTNYAQNLWLLPSTLQMCILFCSNAHRTIRYYCIDVYVREFLKKSWKKLRSKKNNSMKLTEINKQ